jgi:hypothetical protein
VLPTFLGDYTRTLKKPPGKAFAARSAERTGTRSIMTLHTTGNHALCVAWHPVDQRTPNLAPCSGGKLYSASHARRIENQVDHTAKLVGNEVTDRVGAISRVPWGDDQRTAGLDPFQQQPPPGFAVPLPTPAYRDATMLRHQRARADRSRPLRHRLRRPASRTLLSHLEPRELQLTTIPCPLRPLGR